MSKEGSATGVVATWFVAEGETVHADQLIAEVAMDKVDAEVLAPADGTISLKVPEGGEAVEGSVIAKIQ
jgi:pyruvate/2-oxoglutarate dehydrogenase complex dihydrolipoamide acyltransferase (E2) component